MNNARESTARLAELLRREHDTMAEFIVALAEFDQQRSWVELGYSGLFAFLHRELGLSKAAAYFRKTAADLVRRFPEVVEPMRDGRLCITAVVELAKVITHENREEVLPRFFHCSKREAKEVSAALAPQEAPPRREVVTVLPTLTSDAAVCVNETVSTVRLDGPAPAAVRLDEPISRERVTLPIAPLQPRSGTRGWIGLRASPSANRRGRYNPAIVSQREWKVLAGDQGLPDRRSARRNRHRRQRRRAA